MYHCLKNPEIPLNMQTTFPVHILSVCVCVCVSMEMDLVVVVAASDGCLVIKPQSTTCMYSAHNTEAIRT